MGCTYQSRDPERCTYQSSDPEGYTYRSRDPEGYTYESSDSEGCTYRSRDSEGYTYQLRNLEGHHAFNSTVHQHNHNTQNIWASVPICTNNLITYIAKILVQFDTHTNPPKHKHKGSTMTSPKSTLRNVPKQHLPTYPNRGELAPTALAVKPYNPSVTSLTPSGDQHEHTTVATKNTCPVTFVDEKTYDGRHYTTEAETTDGWLCAWNEEEERSEVAVAGCLHVAIARLTACEAETKAVADLASRLSGCRD
ncbi:NBS-LRR type resistance protein [Cucumis melo var. makuwa]|uniref:NBS-LRR type resistance protein n=1 Tax=Cucumis melo var. makuwa TaxID=1194695 RepID=A0A5A7UCK2_CUCMM|nr:NBS-LRR type resistance protein [Cucumis melo var. makuwa]TYK24196.1 NBS-LRR type resistance protein [Cucumis melo var. makuwa]